MIRMELMVYGRKPHMMMETLGKLV